MGNGITDPRRKKINTFKVFFEGIIDSQEEFSPEVLFKVLRGYSF
jgi:hypothetical protein